MEAEILKASEIITKYMSLTTGIQDGVPYVEIDKVLHDEYVPIANWAKYHIDWNWIHPVYIKITEIGLFAMCNRHEKLWMEKSKEIEYAMLNEISPTKAMKQISYLIQWYNQIGK